MTGILLINSMLTNLQTQKTLTDSDVNKKNIYDLFLYLQRVKVNQNFIFNSVMYYIIKKLLFY